MMANSFGKEALAAHLCENDDICLVWIIGHSVHTEPVKAGAFHEERVSVLLPFRLS